MRDRGGGRAKREKKGAIYEGIGWIIAAGAAVARFSVGDSVNYSERKESIILRVGIGRVITWQSVYIGLWVRLGRPQCRTIAVRKENKADVKNLRMWYLQKNTDIIRHGR